MTDKKQTQAQIVPKVKPRSGAASGPRKLRYGTVSDASGMTEEEVRKYLQGRIIVHRSLWEHIPKHSHVSFTVNGAAAMGDRFHTGGFVVAIDYADGGPVLVIEKSVNGFKEPGYWRIGIPFSDIDVLWKKYAYIATIELILITQSLTKKQKQIDELTTRVAALEAKLARR